MTTRLQWLEPLITHLKQDTNLSDIGQFVFPMSHYRGITTKNQMSPSIWIIPREGRINNPSDKRPTLDCPLMWEYKVLICSVVKNVISCDDHVGHEIVEGNPDMYGAYVDACDLETRVRNSILEFNEAIHNSPQNYRFSPLQLCELPEPDEHNGHFILGQIYSTTFSF